VFCGQALLGRTLLEPSGRRLCHGWATIGLLFLGFKGGKGVRLLSRVCCWFSVPSLLWSLLTIWLGMLLAFRYISLASITVAACLPLVLALHGGGSGSSLA